MIFNGHVELSHEGARRALPGGYKAIRYLSAAPSNGAYINLGIVHDVKSTSEIGYIYQSNAVCQIYGATENNGKLRCLVTASNSLSPGGLMKEGYDSINGNFRALLLPYNSPSAGDEVRLRFLIDPAQGTVATNLSMGHMHGYSAPDSYTMTRELYLLGQNYNTGYRGAGLKQVTYFKFWDKTDTLVRDMVPCRRTSDGALGMWDFATQQFFGNAGTGAFTAGEDLN